MSTGDKADRLSIAADNRAFDSIWWFLLAPIVGWMEERLAQLRRAVRKG